MECKDKTPTVIQFFKKAQKKTEYSLYFMPKRANVIQKVASKGTNMNESKCRVGYLAAIFSS